MSQYALASSSVICPDFSQFNFTLFREREGEVEEVEDGEGEEGEEGEEEGEGEREREGEIPSQLDIIFRLFSILLN